MARRLRLAQPTSSYPPTPVAVTRLWSPRGRWALVDAVRMVAVGYPPEVAAARTGYPAATIAAYRPMPRRCRHVEHIETDRGVMGRASYAVEEPWSVCSPR